MMKFLREHWDICFGGGGLLAAITAAKFNAFLELMIVVVTLGILVCKLVERFLRARMAWINRNDPDFFARKKKDDDMDIP